MNLILFVAKIFLCSGILFTYYWLFLRNKRFHHYNRFYLLAIVIISFVFPFLNISVSEKSQAGYPAMHQAIDLISLNSWEGSWGEDSSTIIESNKPILTGKNVMLIAYAVGLILLLAILFKSLLYIIRIRNRYNAEAIGDLKLYDTIEPGTPFSFFKSIFWNHHISFNSKEGQQIFRHELFHVRQHHSSDSLFMELVCIVCWFNPFFHLIRKELKAIHEFLADQYAISGSDRYAYAELLVMESIRQKQVSFVHPFFQNNIKRRIAMITQFNKTRYGYWSRVMALPIFVLLFCIITLKAQQGSAEKPIANTPINPGHTITVVVDAGHGGKDPGAYSPYKNVVEKDLTLAISKKIKEKAGNYNVKVIMTREDDNAPEMKYRTEQALQSKADLIVSIHVGAEPPAVVRESDKKLSKYLTGVGIYMPKQGSNNYRESKMLADSIMESLIPVYKTFSISRKEGNPVWILDKAPCPAILLECGNIANKNDLEFMTNEANQEKLAEAILKGIVSFKSSSPSSQALNSAQPELNIVKNTVVNETNGPNNSSLTEEQLMNLEDGIKKYIAQHLMKTISYPEMARRKNQTTSIYFAVDVDEKGKIQMIDIIKYNGDGDGGISKNPNAQDIVIVGAAGDKSSPIIEVRSEAHDMWEKELDKSIKSYSPPTNIDNIKREKLYFRLVFTLSKEENAAAVSVNAVNVAGVQINANVTNEPITVEGHKIASPKDVSGSVNAQINSSDPVIVAGHQITPVKNANNGNLNKVMVAPMVVEGHAKNAIDQVVVVNGYKKVAPGTEQLPIDLIRDFKVGKTTLEFVKDQIGQPSNQFLDSYVESWAYYTSNERLMLTFNREDGRLINFSYLRDQKTKAILNYDDVKQIQKGVTVFKDVLRKFGKPSEIHIDNNTEGWIYISDNSRLTLMTTDKINYVVSQMTYDTQGNAGTNTQK